MYTYTKNWVKRTCIGTQKVTIEACIVEQILPCTETLLRGGGRNRLPITIVECHQRGAWD